MSRIGIDVGGTFTDLLYIDEETGEQISAKSSSTDDILSGVFDVFEKLDIDASGVTGFGHGSTIATNAIIEQTGAKTALVTTENFEAVLEAARANRPELFDLSWQKSDPVVPRRHVIGVEERMAYDGSVDTELSEEDVYRAAEIIDTRGYEAVAISYLNSFVNPDHERRTQEILRAECDDVYLTRSSEVIREIQEFERTSTTTLNAYLGPLIADYYDDLANRLEAEFGYEGEVTLLNSAGGAANRTHAVETPVRFCNSGPAGGVISARYLGGLAGYDNLITLDMGGTSCDLSLVQDGDPEMTTEWKVEWTKPVQFPAIDIETIGAGGGSIAWIDEGGALNVGPRSAGADPGPACYDQGGTEPTVTDADLVLNRLNPEMFLGGDMDVDPERSVRAIDGEVGHHFGWDTHEAAEGILQVAFSNMVNAIRRITVERGYDPRNFTMFAYGGAGPLHAAELASELDVPRVLVPRHPGVGSAFGVANSDYRFDYLRPILEKGERVDVDGLNRAYDEMIDELETDLADVGLAVDDEAVTVERTVDVRYYGQVSSLSIDVDGAELTRETVDSLVAEFEETFESEFGYTLPENVSEVELVNARVVASGAQSRTEPRVRETEADPRKDERDVWFSGRTYGAPIYDRNLLNPDDEIDGPAVIEQSDTTIVVPPNGNGAVDQYGNVIISL